MNVMRAPAMEPPSEIGSPDEISRFVVDAAVYAPSVHNSQPWWFSSGDGDISLHADTERRLSVADPHGREMMISCGAALFTTRVALRYLGYVPRVRMLPDPDLPNLVARVDYQDDRAAPVEYERELFAEIRRRRTHRGGFDAEPLASTLVAALRDETALENAWLRVMSDGSQRGALAAAVEAADHALRLDSARMREQSKWASPPGSRRRDGVPATAYPARPERTEPSFPSRDFAHGHDWGLPPAGTDAAPRSAGMVAILTTEADRPENWIGAGQALQRLLLLASSCGVVAAMHSQPLELADLRSFISGVLCEGAHPQMVIRLGCTGQRAATVRRPIDEVLL